MIRTTEVYCAAPNLTRPERRGVSRRTMFDEAKAKVSALELSERLCGPAGMRRVGSRWVARCPLPDHEDRSPSFTVFTETNSWYCFGACQVGGDVVDLASHAWGIDNPATAAAEVLLTFGHEIPPRPAAWFRKNKRQRPVRDAIGAARFEHLRRRLYRVYFRLLVVAIEDEQDRRHDEQVLWEATEPLARLALSGMMGGGHNDR